MFDIALLKFGPLLGLQAVFKVSVCNRDLCIKVSDPSQLGYNRYLFHYLLKDEYCSSDKIIYFTSSFYGHKHS